jgi:hypothetical protein
VLFEGQEVESCPYHVNVYDPSGAKIHRDYDIAVKDKEYIFEGNLPLCKIIGESFLLVTEKMGANRNPIGRLILAFVLGREKNGIF